MASYQSAMTREFTTARSGFNSPHSDRERAHPMSE
jgi:hypothetical protein